MIRTSDRGSALPDRIPNAAESASEFDALCDAVFDGRATAEQVARLERLALASPALRRRYVELADQEATLAWGDGEPVGPALAPAVTVASAEAPPAVPVWRRRRFWAAGALVHTLLTACLFGVWFYEPFKPAPRRSPKMRIPSSYWSFLEPVELPAAIWAASAGADLFGGATPTIGAAAPVGVEQALRSGWVRLRFATGAEAVLEGPAVFEVAAADRLVLKAGRCSVSAPEGAEGFRVDTPDGRVVDLGTRFVVRVPEGDAEADGGTEVHVVEGAAELHPASDAAIAPATPDPADRLTTGQARRLSGGEPLSFDPGAYRATLPDRVVAYSVRDELDGTTVLTELHVQRAGRVHRYVAGDLTEASVFAFDGPVGNFTHAVPAPAAGPLDDWLTCPFTLNAGRINPGGSRTPLTESPVLSGENRTPGMAVRFDPPAFNGPGPDVVFFDVQSVVDVPAGDAFHLSPVTFRDGLRSITVERFDLTVGDTGAAVVAPFVLPRLDPDAATGAVALAPETPRLTPPLRFTANAVAVDLSALGYAEGERVGELFVQDARDAPRFIDPTLIVALPEVVRAVDQAGDQPDAAPTVFPSTSTSQRDTP